MFDTIKQEIAIIRDRDPAIKSDMEVFLYPSFKAILKYRKAHKLYEKKHYFLARLVSHRAARKTGIELHTVEDVYEWIDKNIEYGWLGQDGKAHICEMKDFRRQYRTMSVSQTIQQKIGTCIEQVALMHELLDTIEVSNQMYCCRIYEPDDYGNLEEDEHMHCFLLYFQNGKTYHMEHPNVRQKGIYEYPTKEEAMRTIVDYYVNMRGGKESPTTAFDRVPVGMTDRKSVV